ncbi:MAG TPA: sigma-70 family RNA polymerase sigma factor [Candidatus Nitrosotenuis sp.]|nr:sigma-70 family RNA polymerase sigma factor [Candidatus Nitrosotenuis sp.]
MKRMDETDALAVEHALAGDRDAFRALVERHSRSIFRLAYRMTGNEYDAEEVVQETFLRAYRRLDKFESRANFGTWLYRIGVNCALDLMRARQRHEEKREQPLPEESAGAADRIEQVASEAPSPERMVFSGQVGERVAQALSTLSATERAAFVMRHFEGLSIEEIAAALGLGDSAAKNSIFRAVQKLRKALEPVLAAK